MTNSEYIFTFLMTLSACRSVHSIIKQYSGYKLCCKAEEASYASEGIVMVVSEGREEGSGSFSVVSRWLGASCDKQIHASARRDTLPWLERRWRQRFSGVGNGSFARRKGVQVGEFWLRLLASWAVRERERRRGRQMVAKRKGMKSRGSEKPCSSRQGTRQPPSFHSAFYRLFTYNG